MKYVGYLILMYSFITGNCVAQKDESSSSNNGWLSLGGRSTVSAFSSDGFGLGTGGQFRIRLSNQINTDWFADYISIHISNQVRSEYYHIGWSVLFYPLYSSGVPKLQPYVVAGHCFDYNKKTVLSNSSITKSRWGSAVQVGLGNHFNLSDRFDVSVTAQYMIHFTNDLEEQINNNQVTGFIENNSTLDGHLLATISLNYKLIRLWKK